MALVQPAPKELYCQGGLRPSVPSISLDSGPVKIMIMMIMMMMMIAMMAMMAMMITLVTMTTEAIFTIHLARLCERSEGEVET